VEGAQHEAKMAMAALEEAEAEAEAARRAEDIAIEVLAQARSQADRARHKAKKAFAALVKMRTEAAAARRAEQKAIGKGHWLRVSYRMRRRGRMGNGGGPHDNATKFSVSGNSCWLEAGMACFHGGGNRWRDNYGTGCTETRGDAPKADPTIPPVMGTQKEMVLAPFLSTSSITCARFGRIGVAGICEHAWVRVQAKRCRVMQQT
jgi:hypothetical protein